MADYLDQYGRRHRAETIPPIDFWAAAANHAHRADLNAPGDSAWNRGLYRDAAQLHKRATSHGNPQAAVTLVDHLHLLHPTDPRPARWAAIRAIDAALDNPYAAARLLRVLGEVGAGEQVIALATRVATKAPLDNPYAVAGQLGVLREALSRCWVCGCLLVYRGVLGWGVGLRSGCCGLASGAGDVVPDGEADGHFGSVVVCGHQVPVGSEVG